MKLRKASHNSQEADKRFTELVDSAKHANLIDEASSNEKTALHWAIEKGNVDKAKLLLEHGANPLLKNKDNDTAYDIARKHASKSEELLKILPPSHQSSHALLSAPHALDPGIRFKFATWGLPAPDIDSSEEVVVDNKSTSVAK